MYFFGAEKISLHDAMWYYGILGGAVVVTTLLMIVLW